MDEKGRVSLPSAFRREADTDRFVLLQWEKPYLTLFPGPKWVEVQERLLEYRRNDPSAWNHVRLIVANAVEVSPDKQGRVLVPAASRRLLGFRVQCSSAEILIGLNSGTQPRIQRISMSL